MADVIGQNKRKADAPAEVDAPNGSPSKKQKGCDSLNYHEPRVLTRDEIAKVDEVELALFRAAADVSSLPEHLKVVLVRRRVRNTIESLHIDFSKGSAHTPLGPPSAPKVIPLSSHTSPAYGDCWTSKANSMRSFYQFCSEHNNLKSGLQIVDVENAYNFCQGISVVKACKKLTEFIQSLECNTEKSQPDKTPCTDDMDALASRILASGSREGKLGELIESVEILSLTGSVLRASRRALRRERRTSDVKFSAHYATFSEWFDAKLPKDKNRKAVRGYWNTKLLDGGRLRNWCDEVGNADVGRTQRGTLLVLLMFMTPNRLLRLDRNSIHWAKLYLFEYLPDFKRMVTMLSSWVNIIYQHGSLTKEAVEQFQLDIAPFGEVVVGL